MARVASRRQIQPVTKPTSTNSISKYARLSKGQVSSLDISGKKILGVCVPNSKVVQSITVTCIDNSSEEENCQVTPIHVPTDTTSKVVVNSKKRKAATEDDITTDTTTTTTTTSSKTPKRQRVKCDGAKDEISSVSALPLSPAIKKPASTRSTTQQSTITETFRKSQAKKSTIISEARREGQEVSRKVVRSKKAKPAKETEERSRLPAELLELLHLQRAILKTVVLQITHQNSNTPIDISEVIPHISRTWGKRRVTIDDIRTCIAIQDMKTAATTGKLNGCSPFIITDYGRSKICLEIDTSKDRTAIDEDALCKQFEANLHALCAERATDEMSDLDLCFENLSFGDLPKADITPRHQLYTGKQNPMLAKGHRALAELKSGMAMKKQEKETKVTAPKTETTAPNGTKMSLLDRLRAKELAKAQLELPSGPELSRKRAIMRVADVAAVINMLVGSSNPMGVAVISFTMAMLQQKLQDSMRVPMPVEEGVDTVKIIANEVAPEWLRVVNMGGKEHVVIQTRSKPFDSAIAARVGKLQA